MAEKLTKARSLQDLLIAATAAHNTPWDSVKLHDTTSLLVQLIQALIEQQKAEQEGEA